MIQELSRHRALVWALARRDLVARYRGTWLGFGWTLLHPLVYLGAYSLVFGEIARLGIEKYPAFLFVALLPWTWFSSTVLVGSTSILADAPFVKRAAFPSSIPPFVVAAAALVNFLLSLPVLGGVLLAWGVKPAPAWLLLPVPIVLQLALSLGVATTLAALTVRFRDTAQLAQAVMPLAFLLTPIAYPSSALPSWAVWANPLALLAGMYRRILFQGELPELGALAALTAYSSVAVFVGGRVHAALRDRIPEEL